MEGTAASAGCTAAAQAGGRGHLPAPAEPAEDGRQVGQGLGIVGLQLQGPAQRRGRLRRPPAGRQGRAQRRVRLGEARLQGHGAAVAGDGPVQGAAAVVDGGQEVVQVGVAGGRGQELAVDAARRRRSRPPGSTARRGQGFGVDTAGGAVSGAGSGHGHGGSFIRSPRG